MVHPLPSTHAKPHLVLSTEQVLPRYMVCGPDEIYSVAQGTELLVVLLTIYIQGAEQVLPPTMIRYIVWSWRDSRPHNVAIVASDPSLGLESTTAGNFLGHVPSLMAYNQTGPRISDGGDRADRERSLGLAGLESVEAETSPQAPRSLVHAFFG